MFWDTAWALILGFAISGAVQSFVTRKEMEKTLGDHKPVTVAKASVLGMVSSSCSYAASAMAKSLFSKGADFLSAMAFMFASTNLVIELGIVLIILLGWQFFAAEFIGGSIMIVLLVAVGAAVITPAAIARARARVKSPSGDFDPSCETPFSLQPSNGGHNHKESYADSDSMAEGETLKSRLRNPALWADGANYALSDLKMLRKEMLIGFVVAGYLATIVPTSVWSVVFISGHGILTQIENALVGPIIAFLSFVCSVGNIPLAAALWKGGISFGGVISFIFADLVAFPLVMIYRKLYGGKLAVQLVLVFWVVMSIAGFIIEEIFSAAGLVPTNRQIKILSSGIRLDSSTYLDITFFLLFIAMIWLARNRARFGGGKGYAIDPVCQMQVEVDNAPAKVYANGSWVYFCSDNCKERFERSPDIQKRVFGNAGDTHKMHMSAEAHNSLPATSTVAIDPVCSMTVDIASAQYSSNLDGIDYYFCNSGCKEQFDNSPEIYRKDGSMSSQHDEHGSDHGTTAIDPICGMTVDIATAQYSANVNGVDYYFCCSGCKEKFLAQRHS